MCLVIYADEVFDEMPSISLIVCCLEILCIEHFWGSSDLRM